MSHIIAGDPAPTNPSGKLRVEVLAGLGCAFDGIEDPAARAEEILARYDALKRAEVLAEAADRLRAAMLLADDCACETFIRNQARGGESRG
ncbi:hypothetical protein [Streptomyces sp. NBC_01264]|uniref:hypothetical protein n=1 Tax=Streptomyces sp. NBC_01264 TaxID=2903804 RepID=UPI002257DB95|nr:hypothetical protein [Streptomyces sp. NBC_01264]MCX4778110.1 hypothetical protein [Streptomyces sp. NBC_01264]